MRKQPAKLNYFFKNGYVELFMTIIGSFIMLGEDIADAWEQVADSFGDFWENFWPTIAGIFTFEMDWGEAWDAVKGGCVFSFALGKLIFVTAVTTGLTIMLSLLHIGILFPIMLGGYIAFLLLSLADAIYRGYKHISSTCKNPNCQAHFGLPVYKCPSCGVKHDRLMPSRYGIWKRRCQCGNKLPTTFFNGRQKLDGECPVCEFPILNGGEHVDICIPIVGGASSGKTCFVNTAVTQIEKIAPSLGLQYKFEPSGSDDYETNQQNMSRGELPEKTNEMHLKFYQFQLQTAAESLPHLVSLCDVAGEIYSDSTELGQQHALSKSHSFVVVVDPLSVSEYREEMQNTIDPAQYGYSADSIDAVLNMLTTTLENMCNISAKNMLNSDLAVVFTKGDIPGLGDKIGTKAVADYRLHHPNVTRMEALNAVCEQFLRDYNELNFLNGLKSKFKTVQFFSCSALGHNANGSPFESQGVEDPIVWLLSRAAKGLNLTDKISK